MPSGSRLDFRVPCSSQLDYGRYVVGFPLLFCYSSMLLPCRFSILPSSPNIPAQIILTWAFCAMANRSRQLDVQFELTTHVESSMPSHNMLEGLNAKVPSNVSCLA